MGSRLISGRDEETPDARAADALAPDWFRDALAAPWDDVSCEVDGARIEGRAWGMRGRPGIVLLHGNAAHIGWWTFLAPFLADTHRVVALSFGGMGGSDWRESYSVAGFIREMWAVADAGGACDGGPPVLIGHSLGGLPALHASAHPGRPARAVVMIDTAMPDHVSLPLPGTGAHRVYPTLAAAIGRFRLSPAQPRRNAFIMDYLARMAVKPSGEGWTWRFDRRIWGEIELTDAWADLAAAKAPLAIIRGARSDLTAGAMEARMRAAAPPGTPFFAIPDAFHHVMVDQPLALLAALRALLVAWPRP